MPKETVAAPAQATEPPAKAGKKLTSEETVASAAKATKPPAKAGKKIATGRRKTAVATIRLTDGSGKISVNGREFSDYFPTISMQNKVLRPLDTVHATKAYDIIVKAQGGGLNGQAGALSLAIARALNEIDQDLRPALKQGGLLTRDPRRRERNKPGRAGARKRFQFSKR
ncbi:MAG TPA: 30S ribosomal protein S9 [Chthoniobacterales bacterium]|nr:30S ribosomal protein S9 [Chthoniobacterales bacterium]